MTKKKTDRIKLFEAQFIRKEKKSSEYNNGLICSFNYQMFSELFSRPPEEEIMSNTKQEFILQRLPFIHRQKREGKETAAGADVSSECIGVHDVCSFQMKNKKYDNAEEEKY